MEHDICIGHAVINGLLQGNGAPDDFGFPQVHDQAVNAMFGRSAGKADRDLGSVAKEVTIPEDRIPLYSSAHLSVQWKN